MKKILSSVFLLTLISLSAWAQKPAIIVSDKEGWHKIGETTVNLKTDRDNIVIMGADRFKAIRFKVMDAGIDLQDLEVYYEKEKTSDNMSGDREVKASADVDTKGDGASATVKTDTKGDKANENSAMSDANRERIEVRTPIKAGEESRVIELKGGSREIKRVMFTYRTLANETSEKAKVELWGLK